MTKSSAVTPLVALAALSTVSVGVGLVQTGAVAGQAPGQASQQPKSTPKPTKTPEADPPPKGLTVGTVNVTDLRPGVSVNRQLTIGNPNSQDVELRSVTTRVSGPSPGGACSSPADIEVLVTGYDVGPSPEPPTTIRKNSAIQLPVTVRMNNRPVNQDGCRNQTFQFTFTATATSK